MLVSSAHVGVFRIIKELQKEQNQIELNIEAILRSMLRPAQRRQTIEHEQCIQSIFNDHNNRTLMEFLHGIAHNISLITLMLAFKLQEFTGSGL
ncbi:16456_t:CDS:2 [Cetraspora pellucida]|uniref:16456_t:CDS:1 n=1 Tax=Cetraspora pellucida TaxID=1433469 RepID=A0A9N9C422_9GLOM|nr:16456_t:CDS:2 [Cetraspora pellucida]